MLRRLTRWLGESDSLLNRPKWLTCGVRSNICLEVKNLQSETYLERKGLTGKNLILWSELLLLPKCPRGSCLMSWSHMCTHGYCTRILHTGTHKLSTEECPLQWWEIRLNASQPFPLDQGSVLKLLISQYLYIYIEKGIITGGQWYL